MNKPIVLIVYDYFFPGYNAGGPIQSLTNLVVALQERYEFYILTSAFDLNAATAYSSIEADTWQAINLPGSKSSVNVHYCSRSQPGRKLLKQIAEEVKPDVVYLNGIFSTRFFMLPLLVFKKLNRVRVIVCPRGMLQQGALAVKPFKKKLFIAALRMTGLLNKVKWHATNEEEATDIGKRFGKNRGVVIAANIPKKPLDAVTVPDKKAGELRLIFLSLIAPKKNLLLLLQVMKQSNANVTLDIYGPVSDAKYWQRCAGPVNELSSRVTYKGDVNPADVQQTIEQYHAFILLTKGENFGHALYESLSVGRPVITSHFTPWNALQERNAGSNVNIDSVDDCCEAIKSFSQLSQQELEKLCKGAHVVATEYFKSLHPESAYSSLFS